MAATGHPHGDVSFGCRPDAYAKKVFLAGSFNDWVLGAGRQAPAETKDGAGRAVPAASTVRGP